MSIGRVTTVAVVVLALWSVAGRVEAGCTVSTAGVAFGTYNVFSATALASTGTISLHCGAADKNITIHLSKGTSSTYALRVLTGPAGDVINYNLFRDAACTQIWGDSTGGTSVYSNSRPGKNVINLTVYGRIAPGQDVRAGMYSDSVVTEINF